MIVNDIGILQLKYSLRPVQIIDMELSAHELPTITVQYLSDKDPLVRQYLRETANIWRRIPKIDKVIFNDPATIVKWKDGTKTVVKCQDGDTYSKELGLAMCIAKKALGNKGNYYDVFKKYLETEEV